HWVLSRVQTMGHNGMFYWVAAGYMVLGRSPFLLTLVQIVVVSLIPVLVYKTARLLFDSIPVARYAALMTAFFPSMIIWSSMLLKDSIVIFLFCVTVYFSLKLQMENKIRHAVPALTAMVLIFPIRGYVFFPGELCTCSLLRFPGRVVDYARCWPCRRCSSGMPSSHSASWECCIPPACCSGAP